MLLLTTPPSYVCQRTLTVRNRKRLKWGFNVLWFNIVVSISGSVSVGRENIMNNNINAVEMDPLKLFSC